MAVDGLPIYYKNSKLVGPQSSKKRWKEYYLLVCTVVGFVILFAGVLWFVPSIEEDKSYNRAYSSFTGPSLMGVTDTSQEPEINPRPERPSVLPEDSLLKRGVDNNLEVDPRLRKLEEKREQLPVPVPGRGRPNNIEGPEQKKEPEAGTQEKNAGDERESERNTVEHVGDKGGGNKEGTVGTQRVESEGVDRVEEQGEQKEEEDPVTKQRREKIVEVCRSSVCTWFPCSARS